MEKKKSSSSGIKKVSSSAKAKIGRNLKSSSANVDRLHVVPRSIKSDRWAVRKGGAKRAKVVITGRMMAVSRAKKIAKSKGYSKVVVHGADGTITASYEILKGVKKSAKRTSKELKRASK